MNKESGSYMGKRRIRSERSGLRTTHFIAVMSTFLSNPKIKARYQRLLAAGKQPKVALPGKLTETSM